MTSFRRAWGLALAFFFVGAATFAILAGIGREAGPLQIDRSGEPFIAGLKGRFQW